MKSSNLAILLGCIAALTFSGNANVIRRSDAGQSDEVTYQYCSLDSTTSQVNCLASVFRFTADISQLSDGCHTESSNITLNSLSWRVKVCRANNNIYLVLAANSVGAIANWTTEAEATVKLFPTAAGIATQKTVLVKKMPKTRFTVDNPENSIDYFTNHNIFMRDYVEENRATFEIALSTVPLAEKNTTDVDVLRSRLHVMLKDVKDMTRTETNEVTVRGIHWKVVVQRVGGNNGVNGALAVYLEANEADFSNSLSYNVEVEFKLLTFDKNIPAVSNVVKKVYHWGSTKGGVDQFLRWEIFVEPTKKYVLDDRANLLVAFKVSEPKNLWDFYEAPIRA